jgi:hypothetical protein
VTNDVRTPRRHAPAVFAAAAALLTGIAGCGDDPFSFDWDDRPRTAVLYSLDRPELNLASGFNFYTSTSIAIEAPTATGNWDVALGTRGDELVLLPPGALGVDSRARIAALEGLTLDDVTEAPADTALYVAEDAVPVRDGTTYVVRTSQRACSFGTRGVSYAKLEATDIDVANGILTFRVVTNPVCNDRNLVPPN